jgi:hypothetical protein
VNTAELTAKLAEELRHMIGRPYQTLNCAPGVDKAIARSLSEGEVKLPEQKWDPYAAGVVGPPFFRIDFIVDENMAPGSFMLISHGACKVNELTSEVDHSGCAVIIKGVLKDDRDC